MVDPLDVEIGVEPLDRVVNLYLSFRSEGAEPEVAWKWACVVARQLAELREEELFTASVLADLDSLSVLIEEAPC